MEESLILGSIVGHREVDLENIFESLTSRGDEHDASPRAFHHERAVEVHCPVFKLLSDGESLDFYPLSDEIDKCLGLYSLLWLEDQPKRFEFHRPLFDPSSGITIVKDFTNQETCDHRDGM